MIGNATAGAFIVDGDLVYGVNEGWFKKGPNGENVTWYWDSNYTDPVILGQDIDGRQVREYPESMGFVLYGRMEQMNIKWQMGPKPSLENVTKEAGSVYFVKDPNRLSEESKSGFGELYYDDEKGNRIKIGGTGISSLGFQILSGSTNDEIQANLILEDGTFIRSGNFPVAGFDGNVFQGGIISTGMQEFFGAKSFTPGIICGTPMSYNNNFFNSAFGNPALHMNGGVLTEEFLNNPLAKNSTSIFSAGPLLNYSGAMGTVAAELVGSALAGEDLDGAGNIADIFYAWPLLIADEIHSEENADWLNGIIEEFNGVPGWNMNMSDIGFSFLDTLGYKELMELIEESGNATPEEAENLTPFIGAVPTFIGNKFTTRQIGLGPNMPIHQAYIRNIDAENFYADTIVNMELTTQQLNLSNPVSINGTNFDGHTNITTDTWGYSRNFQISATASPNASAGTNINGGDAQNILYIPSVMSNFTSITTATLLADTIGSTTKWSQSYIGSLFLKGMSDSIYHTITSETNSAKTMTIANDSGYFAYAPLVLDEKNNLVPQAVGDTNSPVYVTGKGCITACSEISTKHGGTGRNIVSTGHILVGADVTAADGKVTNSSMVALAPGAKGSILVSTGADQNPTYITPTLSMPTSNGSTLVVRFSTNENSDITIPNASADKAGIITTGVQQIAGAKTFTAALTAQKGITVSSGLTVSGTTTFNDGFTTKKDITLTGGKISHSGALTTSAATNLVLEAGSTSGLYLKGGLLVLDSNMYGTGDPPTPTVEGQVYFKIVN